jgi:hypothetical protein
MEDKIPNFRAKLMIKVNNSKKSIKFCRGWSTIKLFYPLCFSPLPAGRDV